MSAILSQPQFVEWSCIQLSWSWWSVHSQTWSATRQDIQGWFQFCPPSQWETSLQRKAVSHWLGANLESALITYIQFRLVYLITMQDPPNTASFWNPIYISWILRLFWKYFRMPGLFSPTGSWVVFWLRGARWCIRSVRVIADKPSGVVVPKMPTGTTVWWRHHIETLSWPFVRWIHQSLMVYPHKQ